MPGSALPGWYPADGGSPGLRWWDGTNWTEHVAAPGSVLDRGAFEASRTWREAWYTLIDPAGTPLGDAYEVQTSPPQMVPVPMVAGRWAAPQAAFGGLQAVIRDTRQAHLLSVVRPGPEPFVTVCGPDRTTLGTISYPVGASHPAVDVTLGSIPAYRIVTPDRGGRSRGASRFSVQRTDGAEVGSLTFRRVVDRASSGPARTTQPGIRFALAISVTDPQPVPAAGLLGALPVALAVLVVPALGMNVPASPPDLSGLGQRALEGLAGALVEGLGDIDWS